mmetsp:Transcript_34122/g.82512  ORF Transcript_34122/g.82512 Transcript_34122/m.82512 type:complete len:104 (+) Transcript_34122:479-790(+)
MSILNLLFGYNMSYASIPKEAMAPLIPIPKEQRPPTAQINDRAIAIPLEYAIECPILQTTKTLNMTICANACESFPPKAMQYTAPHAIVNVYVQFSKSLFTIR